MRTIFCFLIGNSLSRIDGIILVLLFGFNIYVSFRKKKREPKPKNLRKPVDKRAKTKYIMIFIFSLVVLLISSKYAVQFASAVSLEINLPEIIIGLFFISFATTLPEFIFGINAIILKHPQMSIGDQTGTIFANICFILGVVSIISPISIPSSAFLIPAGFLLFSSLIFVFFSRSGKKLGIKEGIFLIALYFVFAALQLFLEI